MTHKNLLSKLFVALFAIVVCCITSTPSLAAKRLIIYDLRCEFMTAPLAIDNTTPLLSWKMESMSNGSHPTAYQIIVATDPAKLSEKSADLWNSGKQPYSGSNIVKYEGKELGSRDKVYWCVRVWDEGGKPTKWSSTSSFGIGLLRAEDWANGASFIGIEQKVKNYHTAPLLRKKFDYNPALNERAMLYINSLGYYELYVNGKAVTTTVLNPAVSQYEKRSLINTYDVTSMLQKGENEIVVWAGIGWYHPKFHGVVEGGPYIRLQLDAVAKGSHKSIVWSDSTWQAAESGRYGLGDEWTNGECIDQRALVSDLTPASLDKLEWKPAKVANIPDHVASAQMCEQNVFYKRHQAKAVHKVADDCYVYDMGHVLVGFVQVKMPKVDEGKKISLMYDDFYLSNPNEFHENKVYEDLYIGDGKSEGKFESKFQYKAFRYLKIKGLTQPLALDAITAQDITTDYDGFSSFECSDKDLNDIHNMIHKTVKALSLGGYMVDCPHIERLGYGGDGNASTPTFHAMYDVPALYMNWLTAWADSQKADGDMPHTAPNPIKAGGGPFWCEFLIIASWQSYLNYGDSRMMERFYPNMVRWIEFAERHKVDGVLRKWDENKTYRWWYLGDWATPTGIDQTDPQSIDLVSNCVLSESYLTMAKIAKVLGKQSDAEAYQKKHAEQNAIIHKTFFDSERKSYATATQTDLIYPMFVNATPESEKQGVVATLKLQTAERFKGHLSTGLVGVPIITQWATREGEADFIYHMLKKREYPGYLYMIDNGADFTWEHWNGDRSRVHNCYNGIGSWFYQALAGITVDEEKPAYEHIIIRPQVVSDIDWVKASKNTPYGQISVDWQKKGNKFILDVCIPVGSSATLYMPDGKTTKVGSGVHRVESAM